MIEQIKPYKIEDSIPDVTEYLKSGSWLVEFKRSKEFAEKIANFLGVDHCIFCNSGTTALALACMTMAYIKNDNRRKVLVPDFTMIASSHAVTLASCIKELDIQLVDIDPSNLCMNIEELKNIDPSDICGIIYVSVNGRCGNIIELREICKKNDWFLIEDSCQSFGSKYSGHYLGTFGDIGCFSLSPQKIITTGQGGFLVTNDDELAFRIRKFKDHGRVKGGVDEFDSMGFNFKYTDLQAIIGMNQLKTIDYRMKRKKEIYNKYYNNLSEKFSMLENSDEVVPWMVDIYSIHNRKNMVRKLSRRGIVSRVVYPPLHDQYPFSFYSGLPPDYFKVTSHISNTGLWLPSYIDITDSEIDLICNVILEDKNG